MSFLYPSYFWLLLLLLLIFVQKDLKQIRLSVYGYIVTSVFIVIALARPVIEQEPLKKEQYLSDVVLAVDLSYSMHATDIKPSRSQKVKELLQKLLKSEQKSRFGVLGFTTNAIILSPLSEDSEVLMHLFSSLDETLIMTKGSAVMPALKLARKISHAKQLSVVLLSDGGDKQSYKKEALFAQKNGLKVNILMIATKMGATITLEDGELLKDENGNIVVSRENEHIKLIADASGGVYTKDLSTLLLALESQREAEVSTQSVVVQNIELFYYFIVLAIITFLLSVTKLKRIVLAWLLIFGISLDASVLEYLDEKTAQEAYVHKEYEKAIEYYKKVQTNHAYFNLANSYYKNGEYEKALVNYEKVKSSDINFKAKVFYNMANTFVRLKKFKKAKENYLKSLTLCYTKEADDNYRHIRNVAEQKTMQTGEQKTKKHASFAQEQDQSHKKKDAGSSNMNVSAKAGSGASDMGKKIESEAMFNLNSTKAKLSSKQYELINKRGVNEQKPW